MKNEPELQKAFRRLAAALPREAGPATEERVLAAFRARSKSPKRARAFWAIAAAAALVLAWFAVQRFGRTSRPAAIAAGGDTSLTAGFIALPYAQSDVPLEQAVIVRVNLQPWQWGALDLPVAPARAGDAISADLLVGQDGVARAVRFVSVQ